MIIIDHYDPKNLEFIIIIVSIFTVIINYVLSHHLFQIITKCPVYSVTKYTLVMEDIGNRNRNSWKQENSSTIGYIEIYGLNLNTNYSYYVKATNAIGDAHSNRVGLCMY